MHATDRCHEPRIGRSIDRVMLRDFQVVDAVLVRPDFFHGHLSLAFMSPVAEV